ncbi:MAG TPA: translation elongation factor Ts [bacterium]|nr:translation elongation factor Ts [bacterium]
MQIDSKIIQKLRATTGAGIMDVKKALEEAGGDEQKALEILRIRGQKIATKKQEERVAKEGAIAAYVHANGKVAALVMLACETDFVARNEEFKSLAHDIAMQVAAMNPQFLTADKVPQDVVEKEKEIMRASLQDEKKPAAVLEKIMAGKLQKFFEEVCLLEQKFIKDDTKTIADLINEQTAKLGEKIEVKKIARLSL